LGKKLKALKSQSSRIISKRNPSQRKTGTNTSSGFLKPVAISKDIAKFAGWDVKEKKSRVAVTKALCDYIKEHKLQNEKDKRQILPDAKLCKLLNYDPKTASQPLTYFHLQSLLKNHFIKETATAVTA
jgi:chromatin remodeling complex protein RSC6